MTDQTLKSNSDLSNPARRQWLKRAALAGGVAASALVLAGCGQKGPLYIPGDGEKKKKKGS